MTTARLLRKITRAERRDARIRKARALAHAAWLEVTQEFQNFTRRMN